MNALKSIHELVREYNFVTKGACHCAGYETIKYQAQDGMVLEWRKHAATFKLYRGRDIFTQRWDSIVLLEGLLEKHANGIVHE